MVRTKIKYVPQKSKWTHTIWKGIQSFSEKPKI